MHGQSTRPFSNISRTSHRNRLLLFVKHLAVRILTRKYRIMQHYADKEHNFVTYPAIKQSKLRSCRFQAVHQMQQHNTAAINKYWHCFVFSCVNGLMCSRQGCVLNGRLCIILAMDLYPHNFRIS
jgi:hypothetical protein